MVSDKEDNSFNFNDWKSKNQDAFQLRRFIKLVGGNNLKEKRAAYKIAKEDIDSVFGDESYLGLTFSQYDNLLNKIICDEVGLKFLDYKEKKNNLKKALKNDTSGVIKELKDDLILKSEELHKIKNENKSLLKNISEKLVLIKEYKALNKNLEVKLNVALADAYSKKNKIIKQKESIQRLLSFMPDVDSNDFNDKFPVEILEHKHKYLLNRIKLLKNDINASSLKIEILKNDLKYRENSILNLKNNILELSNENTYLKNKLATQVNDDYYKGPFKLSILLIILLVFYIFFV